MDQVDLTIERMAVIQTVATMEGDESGQEPSSTAHGKLCEYSKKRCFLLLIIHFSQPL
jgi:hypothetical protein